MPWQRHRLLLDLSTQILYSKCSKHNIKYIIIDNEVFATVPGICVKSEAGQYAKTECNGEDAYTQSGYTDSDCTESNGDSVTFESNNNTMVYCYDGCFKINVFYSMTFVLFLLLGYWFCT